MLIKFLGPIIDFSIKFLGPIIGFFISFINIYIIKKEKNAKFTLLHKILIGVIIIACIISSIIIVQESNEEQKKINLLQKIIKADSLTKELLKEQIVESKANEKNAKAERNELKLMMQPVIEIAEKTYPNLKLGKAIENIVKDIDSLSERTKYLETRETYRPLSSQKRNSLINEILNLNQKLKDNLKIEITCSIDNLQRKNFAIELKELLESGGFKQVEVTWGMNLVIGQYQSPIVTYFNGNEYNEIYDILDILDKYLFTYKNIPIFQPRYKYDKSNFITFDIKANPFFNIDGIVSFE